jgi:hypothetical protein
VPPTTTDPARLLSLIADALNQCERYGIIVDLEHGAAMTTQGYVLPVGDCRLGSRWAVRAKLPAEGEFCLEGSEED